MKIIWSPLAHERINEIADHIAEDNLAAAERWANSIYNHVSRLKDFPKSGRVVPEVGKEHTRKIFLGNYRIIYRLEQSVIKVLTVRHGKQLLPAEDLSNE